MIRDDIFPPKDALPGSSLNWGRAVETRIRELERSMTSLRQDADGLNRATAASLQDMSGQLTTLSTMISRLTNASQVFYADSGTSAASVSPGTWFPFPPTTSASSGSGKFRISVSASGNDGIAFAGFETAGYPRTRMVGGTPEAALARVSVLGAASALGSASKEWVVSLTPDEEHVFSAQVLGAGGSLASYIMGVSITVQPLL